MNKQEENSISKTMDVEYTEQDVREMREQGISEDELPHIGIHKFQRSRFITKRNEQKIKVSLYLDADVLDFFKEAAEKADAESYETQINKELRQTMERKQQKRMKL